MKIIQTSFLYFITYFNKMLLHNFDRQVPTYIWKTKILQYTQELEQNNNIKQQVLDNILYYRLCVLFYKLYLYLDSVETRHYYVQIARTDDNHVLSLFKLS